MKKALAILVVAASAVIFTGCGSNYMARQFGGEMTLVIPKGQKLVNITWKEDSLWYLTKPMTEDDVAEEYTFQADSNFGIFEGTVHIKEMK